MFADDLLRAEQMHLFRLLVWGGASVVAGTLIFVALAWRRPGTTILRHFAIQSIGWGALEVAYAAVAWHGVQMRDLAGATRLDRLLWFNLGLDLGLVTVGAAIGLLGWAYNRRLNLVGAGAGVVLQGAALFLINAQLASMISR